MKILTFSTLYPSAVRPSHGIFVETRLRYLLASGAVSAKVVAPVPWFFSSNPAFGAYADFARTARRGSRNGIDVYHPRYLLVPKLGMLMAPYSIAAAASRRMRQVQREGFDFDLIDAHYFYPDGVAAVMLGKRLNKPVVITARGTDLSLIPKYRLPRAMIQWAAGEAAGMITVCAALKTTLVELGADESKITVLRNGVDLQRFVPGDREAQRRMLNLSARTLLSVGHLIERKGHDIVIRALAFLENTDLLIVGTGPEDAALRRLAAELGVASRVRFVGAVEQRALKDYYGAADALVLASSREGWANVLLEAMACGTPVVASDVWGTPEVVAAPEAGVLMKARTPQALAAAVEHLFAHMPDRAVTRRYAERFSWDATTAGQIELFNKILTS